MNSATSKTDGSSSQIAVWQIYALLGMLAAAAAVWVSKNTHPVALILLSVAAILAGAIALTVHRAATAFFSKSGAVAPLDEKQRAVLEREKALVLRSIKELEFDKAMGKIGEQDFAGLSSRLRARAISLMQDLERQPASAPSNSAGASARRAGAANSCANCKTVNDSDAKFCKGCGYAL